MINNNLIHLLRYKTIASMIRLWVGERKDRKVKRKKKKRVTWWIDVNHKCSPSTKR